MRPLNKLVPVILLSLLLASTGALVAQSAPGDELERPWFANWLHGTGDATFAEASMFEVGANQWRTFDAWPPKEAKASPVT